MKKILIIILSFLFLLSLFLPAFATSVGVGAVLTLNEVAACVLGAFGVAVPAASLPNEFGQAMLDTIAAAAGPGLDSHAVSQAVQSWADLAVQGTIQIASALPWIQTGVKDFVEAAPDSLTAVSTAPGAPANSENYVVSLGKEPFSVRCTAPVDLAYFGSAPSSSFPEYPYTAYVILYSTDYFSYHYLSGGSTIGASLYSDASGSIYWSRINPFVTGIVGPFYENFKSMYDVWSSSQDSFLSSLISPSASSVPVGGIQAVLPEYGLSGVSVPDLSIAAAAAAGGITASVFANNAIEQLHNGTLPWVTYVGTVAGGASATIAIPGTAVDALGNTIAVTSTYALVESGLGALLSSVAASPETPVVPEPGEFQIPEPGEFQMDLTEFFPFCIPFDLYKLFSALNAMPQAPVFDWPIPLTGGSTYNLHVDLTPFDSVASVVRTMELLAFCIALALRTRELIRG